MMQVYIDGSSKGNPGPGGAGIVIRHDGQITSIHGIPLGHVTNNQTEFLALKHALGELKARFISRSPINILTDSQLAVGIFSLNWNDKANLDLVVEIKGMLREFPQETFTHVRGRNRQRARGLPCPAGGRVTSRNRGVLDAN